MRIWPSKMSNWACSTTAWPAGPSWSDHPPGGSSVGVPTRPNGVQLQTSEALGAAARSLLAQQRLYRCDRPEGRPVQGAVVTAEVGDTTSILAKQVLDAQ